MAAADKKQEAAAALTRKPVFHIVFSGITKALAPETDVESFKIELAKVLPSIAVTRMPDTVDEKAFQEKIASIRASNRVPAPSSSTGVSVK